MKWIRKAAVLLAVATVMVVGQAAAQNADFSIGSQRYTLPLPEGFCVPERPADVARIQGAAALDRENVTVLSLVRCDADDDPLDYFLFKVPVPLVATPITLSQLVAEAGPEFDRNVDYPVPDVEQRLGQAASANVSLEIGARGHDAQCLYVAGVAHSDAFDGGSMSLGGCITVVAERAIMVFAYNRGDQPEVVSAQMRRARAVALSISRRP